MNTTKELECIEATWAVKLPNRFSELFDRMPNATHAKLGTGELFHLPFSLLEPSEIVSASDVAADWDLPNKVVPIIGDFHDLVCLDYRSGTDPRVISLNYVREERFLFETLDGFLDALTAEPEEPTKPSGVVSSWFNF